MKKIGYILYCIFIIITSITINVFIGNSDRNLDYIMNDVIEHYTCDEEEECAGGVGAGAGAGGVGAGAGAGGVGAGAGAGAGGAGAGGAGGVGGAGGGEGVGAGAGGAGGAGGGGDSLYYKNNCLEKHQDSLKELIKDECLIGRKTGDICPLNFSQSLEDGDVKKFCKDRIYGHTWASPIQNTSECNQDTNHLNN